MTATAPTGETVDVYVGPTANADIDAAVARGGARPVTEVATASAVVWLDPTDVDGLRQKLHSAISWVQLPAAGVEAWLPLIEQDRIRRYTSARGAYGRTVAEHTLALLLAGARNLHLNARARSWSNDVERAGQPLDGQHVLIVGCGSIGTALIPLLVQLGALPIAVTRSGRTVDGATSSISFDELGPPIYAQAPYVVLAAPSTEDTRRLIGRDEFAAMRTDTWLVNVGRGDLVDTAALVDALRTGEIRGAALDVTDPEPLPEDHPLWNEPRALITPHNANPPAALERRLAERVETNVRRFVTGDDLIGAVDPALGY